ncbi:MAG: hypothetical protein ACLSE8_00085 [Parasutterella sp.]
MPSLTLTTTETGDTASISFATKATTGTDVAALHLGLTEDSGAVLSQGSDALTPAQEYEPCHFCFS